MQGAGGVICSRSKARQAGGGRGGGWAWGVLLWMPVLLAEGGSVYRVGVDGGVCVRVVYV